MHLVEPLGFEITNSQLKRAGLDYWEFAEVKTHGSLDSLIAGLDPRDLCFFSKKASHSYLEAGFQGHELLVFGSETVGLAEELLGSYPERSFQIPIIQPAVRSLNLANAVAIVVYEALRQVGGARLNSPRLCTPEQLVKLNLNPDVQAVRQDPLSELPGFEVTPDR